jgi:hypothetical protein
VECAVSDCLSIAVKCTWFSYSMNQSNDVILNLLGHVSQHDLINGSLSIVIEKRVRLTKCVVVGGKLFGWSSGWALSRMWRRERSCQNSFWRSSTDLALHGEGLVRQG